jgi:hypothetical protein
MGNTSLLSFFYKKYYKIHGNMSLRKKTCKLASACSKDYEPMKSLVTKYSTLFKTYLTFWLTFTIFSLYKYCRGTLYLFMAIFTIFFQDTKLQKQELF